MEIKVCLYSLPTIKRPTIPKTMDFGRFRKIHCKQAQEK